MSGITWLANLVARVDVAIDGAIITLDRLALIEALESIHEGSGAPLRLADTPIGITIAARLQRCGKQMRLILGTVETDAPKLDADLVQLVRDGHRWFEDLNTGKASSIAAIAKRDRQHVPHVSRTISLAFLAPDIAEMILTGRQPITLTHERLKAARPLPIDWNDQRRMLLD